MTDGAKRYEYLAQRFRQRDGQSSEMLLFVAPAADVRTWAGIPRKTFDYQHGFQRSLNSGRVGEITEYFSDDKKNISPTAIVVGFNHNSEAVTVEAVTNGAASDGLVQLVIEIPDFEALELRDLIDRAATALESRLPKETIDTIRADLESAVNEASTLHDEANGEGEGQEGEAASASDVLEKPDRSYLADFYAELLGYSRGLASPTDEEKFRQILYSILKPAIIVDGQHRVFGAASADETIKLAVCALAESDWVESVYQFVVINQKAKPIKPAFLNSIIATSLSDAEIKEVYDRLDVSNVDVEKAQIMNRVNVDTDSPFRGMIDFEVEGSTGFLQFPGMSKLVRDFRNIPRTHASLLPKSDWGKPDDIWLQHFYALWRGIRSYFEGEDPRLWQEPSEGNPNNLLKIVSLQELQRLMLDNWADSRAFQFSRPSKTESAAKAFWKDFPSAFFTDEWRKKGLQTSVGRTVLRNAITDTRRNLGRRQWGHRRLGLFREE
jgi:hypothetical protein